MVAQNVFFGIIAAAMVLAAIKVVTTKNVVHAALYLVIVFGGMAAQFILLAAEFTAIVQVLVYVGAIIVLILFGVMLTRARLGKSDELTSDQWWIAAGVSLLLLGTLAYVLIDAFGDNEVDPVRVQRTAEVGNAIFSDYIIPFQAVGALLLVALVGAIVLARRD
ncbi:MAG: NADH-quinone oxidoreductase subunit J [Acidimicrobiales bacterium]|nr:NADH-quinone oxidoreductase subunit J [Acidimicrobiales bacterium]